MEAAIKKQSSFSRSLANDAKLGAYYTDISMCRRISHLLRFPDGEVCCLEPSIGDGSAVAAVTNKEMNENIKIFGVELNRTTYEEDRKNPQIINYIINADFLSGVKISHSAFSFCFANPPYGVDEDRRRLEARFVEKVFPYLKANAVFVLVIPHYVLLDESFQRIYLARFNPVGAWKFDEKVYEQFKQICIIGLRKHALGYLADTLKQWQEQLEEDLPYLPQEPVDKPLCIAGSKESAVEYFTTLEFDSEAALGMLSRSPLLSAAMGKRIYAGAYSAAELGQPIVPLSPDMCYLVSSVGGGQGYAGSAGNRTLHLQRGKAVVTKTSVIEMDETESHTIEKETSATRITLKVIQADGKILDIK